ncbi:methyl-accepting chemotaxis protein [Candidatus Woesearchaeota archaeon]|nr:methyl-accepting chemotaxis protein [Candidatus Woesearchaeota archaeon]
MTRDNGYISTHKEKIPFRLRIGFAYIFLVVLPIIYFITNSAPSNVYIYWSLVVIIASSNVFFFMFITKFASDSEELSNKFHMLAKGNFQADTSIKEGETQIGRMVNSFRRIKNFFQELIKTIGVNFEKMSRVSQDLITASGEVNASTEEISSTVQEIARGAQRQSKQVNQIAHNVKTFTDQIKNVAEKMTTVSKSTELANKNALEGNKSAQEANAKIMAIKNTVSNSGKVVQSLGEKSKEINKIIEVIDDISEQTNMLALNANIEAARAGEAGRGFAVVADEVRKLAEQSQKATQQISTLITDIQQSTSNAVDTMASGEKHVEEGAEVINNALISLEGISAIINNINNMTSEAENIINGQVKIVDQINTSMNEISAITEENAAGSEEVSASIQETTSTIQQLTNYSTDLSKSIEDMTNVLKQYGFEVNTK